MREHPSFELFNKLILPKARNRKEKILIYRSIDR